MQQYFSDTPLVIGEEYVFNNAQTHHARDVVRLHHERIRLVYDGIGYFAECYNKDKAFVAKVLARDERINEIGIDLTLAVGLIRREKFELILQKATELGVTRIVPFVSSRCIVKAKKEKEDKQQSRWNDILMEAAEQCKRNCMPVLEKITDFKSLSRFRSELNFVPYENAYGSAKYIQQAITAKKSVTVVIGPEGGFSDAEIMFLKEQSFETVTLGRRILRAETAAIYACSIISEINECAIVY